MTANSANTYSSFETLNERLEQIVNEVADETLPLDDVLALYEEAVNLGLRGCDLLEEGIQAYEEQEVEQEAAQDAQSAEGAQLAAGTQPDDALDEAGLPSAADAQSGEARPDAAGHAAPQNGEAAGRPVEAKPQ